MPAGTNTLAGIACSPKGSLYAACSSKVFYLDLERKKATVFAGGASNGEKEGPRLEVQFTSLHGIGVGDDETVYVACSSSHTIFSIREDRVERFSGTEKGHKDGPRLSAEYNCPQRVVELNGEQYIADCWNHSVRKIDKSGIVSTIGVSSTDYVTGPLTTSCIPYIRGLCTGIGNTLIASSSGPHRISKIDFDRDCMEAIAGSDKDYGNGQGGKAKFNFPFDVTINKVNGDIFVADDDNFAIRHINAATLEVHSLVGHGPNKEKPSNNHSDLLKDTYIAQPTGICLTVQGDLVWSSRDSLLRFIPGIGPNLFIPEVCLPSFEAYLDDSKYAEHQVTLASGKVLNLVPDLLSLWDLNVASVQSLIQNHATMISEEAVLQLFRFLYAQTTLIDTIEKPLLLAQVWYLSTILFSHHEDNSIIVWTMFTLKEHFERLSLKSLLKFGKKHGSTFFTVFPACGSLWSAITSPKYKKGENSKADALLAEDKALESLIRQVSNFSIGSLSEARKTTHLPTDTLTNAMEALSVRICEFATKPDTDMTKIVIPAPDFSFAIEERSYRLQCHSWILQPRWKYFSAMMDAGLNEAREMRAELPSDFSPAALAILIRFIYTGRVSSGLKDVIALNTSEAEQLAASAAQYRLVDYGVDSSSDGNATETGFKSLLDRINVTRSKGNLLSN